MNPREYGESIAANWPPLSPWQVDEIAKVLATVELELGEAA